MLFNSYEFIFIYLPIVIMGYFTLARVFNDRAAKYFLIVSSVPFYSYWDIRNLPVLLVSILVNFVVGQRLAVNRNKKLLWLGILFNLFKMKRDREEYVASEHEQYIPQ